MSVLLAILVFFTMAGVDFCHAKYVRAMLAGKALPAAFWSVGQWMAASVGFVIAVKVSMWYLIFEAMGLFVGSLLGTLRMKEHNPAPKS